MDCVIPLTGAPFREEGGGAARVLDGKLRKVGFYHLIMCFTGDI